MRLFLASAVMVFSVIFSSALNAQALTFASPSFEYETTEELNSLLSSWHASNLYQEFRISTYVLGYGTLFGPPPTSYSPTDGRFLAYIGAQYAPKYSIYQDGLTATSGESFSFDWNFLARDEMPFNDSAQVVITGTDWDQTLLLSDVDTVGDYGSSGWQTFNYVFDRAFTGSIAIEILSYDWTSDLWLDYDSSLALDNFRSFAPTGDGPAPVPEPSTFLLSALGLVCLGFCARRRRGRAG